MNVDFYPAAAAELELAAQWYEERSIGLRQEFLTEFRPGVRQIMEHPHAWQHLGCGVRRYRLGRFPYGIVYVTEDDQIVVLAVGHLRRKPGYWKPRLKNKR
ncbi:MAG: type II toxin-antitoxin system RelE/ParE family toxin [Hyphomicrobium sp.]|uniref:type II toxin-antitoxin system RelE/ParE family toxin n=1 Tax=Hyphomicrobium sp. TaxID=82 RepID=UPI001320CC0A|nr:type II toxin-antitoxin system RelE/ParE family toxin [Hyphomicrobium sp.]KAB2942516.1 MAG: type II toxin-antitoxin system RelE/ParE family toxin [Hyphomicrobium sp.]MBZ0208483.1 type II toxin-antitoxin system RelE/ParE family toxin [Hyphomicrobium sp.]